MVDNQPLVSITVLTNARVNACLRSCRCQSVGVLFALLIVAALNRQSDGLWFQGDAPRHAANGLFWWDLLTALPRDPIEVRGQILRPLPGDCAGHVSAVFLRA